MKPRVYPQDISCVLPSSQQKGGIYISNLQASQNLQTLKKYKIKSVLTSCSGVFLCHPKSDVPYYLYIPGQDHQNFDLSRYFNQAALFIKQSIDKTNVLVHCMAGISRSVTLVLAYLIKYRQFSTQDALNKIKTYRTIAQPNKGFISQLKKFEGQLKLNKIKTQSIFSIQSPIKQKQQKETQSKDNNHNINDNNKKDYYYSLQAGSSNFSKNINENIKSPRRQKYQSMNRSALLEQDYKTKYNYEYKDQPQKNYYKNTRRDSLQPYQTKSRYQIQSMHPSIELTSFRDDFKYVFASNSNNNSTNLNNISVKLQKNQNSTTTNNVYNTPKKSPLSPSLKDSRKSSLKDSRKSKKRVTFNLNPQYFQIQSEQFQTFREKQKHERNDYKSIDKHEYPHNLPSNSNISRRYTPDFQRQTILNSNKKPSTISYDNYGYSDMSQLDRKIQAITKKYDQHLYQNSKRVLTNNYLNTKLNIDTSIQNPEKKQSVYPTFSYKIDQIQNYQRKMEGQESKTPKFSDNSSTKYYKNNFSFEKSKNDLLQMNLSRKTTNSSISYQSKSTKPAYQNVLSGNKTIDRILQRKNRQNQNKIETKTTPAGSIRKNVQKYSDNKDLNINTKLNFNY